MFHIKGFTFIELIIVLIIIGIVFAFYSPNFYKSNQQAYSQAAQNNLLAVNSAQLNYFNNNGSYCLSLSNTASPACTGSGDSTCGDSLAQINCNLSLNITDTYAYRCTNTSLPYQCIATSSDGTTVLTLNGGSPIVLTGAQGALPRNPYCTGPNCPG